MIHPLVQILADELRENYIATITYVVEIRLNGKSHNLSLWFSGNFWQRITGMRGAVVPFGLENRFKEHFIKEFAEGLRKDGEKEIPGVGKVVWDGQSRTATLEMDDVFYAIVHNGDKDK